MPNSWATRLLALYLFLIYHSNHLSTLLLWVGNIFKLLYVVQGYTEIKKRSILTSMENYVTVHLESGSPIYTPT
jgi:hypothetical protein